MSANSILQNILILFAFICLSATIISAQTTVFTYQGKLTDTSNQPSGTYQMQFKLFDAASGGMQQPQPMPITITLTNVSVTSGIFTVNLDFGVAAFDGADRFLEIAVKRNAGDSFTILSPRQQFASAPYSIRSLNAGAADNSQRLNGLAANQFVQTGDSRLTDERNPLPNSPNYIQNTATQQTDAKFNISGNGTLGGTLQASEVKAQTASGNYGLRHTDGTTSLGSYIGGSASGASGAWLGTVSNHPLHFFTNSGQPKMTIDAAGNVGIGTFTPFAGIKLDVNGDALIRTSGSGGNIQFGTPGGETGMSIIGTNRADFRFDGSTLKLAVGPLGGPPPVTNGIVINTSGNVGIGTSTPASKLDVAGNIFTSGSLNVGNGAGITGSLSVSNGATINGGLNVGNGATISNGLNVNSGNLNVSGAGANLNVASGISLGFVPAGGDFALCYKTSTKFIANCSASSLRYKQDVQNFYGGLSIINRLRPISFSWKDDGRRDIGFAAEEVEQIEPLLSFRNVRGEIEGVKYQLIGVVLVEAVKEQQTQIEQQNQQIERQNQQINEQQNRLESQQRQIDALKQLICQTQPEAKLCQ
jgi:hypothetical protein